ncbi:hypothetical protein EOJ36_03885 [Sandaracinomonas limnophila]|uniref:DUF1566 domain-containing protein n=1 Tax=Sandaracinomonas limnophila TaxID=1862386 RepID=A0A437PTL0_9BACT|nr:hypothetical protein [Sandaracinomonas limnophila]RVU25567.1 hypothetical protein EOJ36_03885 [Sandaracinomonas limnophila]
MKNILCFFVLILLPFSNAFGKNIENQDVYVTATGNGKSIGESKQSALRNAIEQAFGVFISSKTEILNDQVVADQMASVANGNIKSFELLNETQLPDGTWSTTIKSLVSVGKLTSFVQSKGIEVEFKGGLFAANIKQQMLNEIGESQSVYELVGLMNKVLLTSLDYKINSGNPQALDSKNTNWAVPLTITLNANKNMDFTANYMLKTLRSVGMTNSEIQSYKALGKNLFKVSINYLGKQNDFFLRSEYSFSAIQTLIDFQNIYFTSFNISPEIVNGYNKSKSNLKLIGGGYSNNEVRFDFLTNGDEAGNYSFLDYRSLKEIEQLNGYKIKSAGEWLEYRQGGFVIVSNNGQDLILSLVDLGEGDKNELKNNYNSLNIGGYHDWEVPSFDVLEFCDNWAKQLNVNLFKSIGGLTTDSDKRFYNTNDKYVESNAKYGTCYSCRNAKPTTRLIRIVSTKK